MKTKRPEIVKGMPFPLYMRNLNLLNKYGMTVEEYNSLLESQNGVCLICGLARTNSLNNKPRHMPVDHDHDTGKTRGILCPTCNGRLGWYEKYMFGIHAYLARFK